MVVALALYRKYRPRTFAEVIGQDHVTEPIMQALRTGRVHHAYLFSGPRGCGKTSSARILARSLNCAKGPTPQPCGECDSCVALAPDGPGSVDVIEIDAASHGGVDDARELRERAFFAPVASRFKVYVIDEAHMVTSQGFNALLKLVEEPPEFVVFVFATTEPDKVLGTIRSRTHHYPFRLMPPGVLRPYLEQLCQQEGVTVEPAVFPLVVRAGGGSARDSLSVLDQLIAGAGPDGVSYSRAVDLLGVTDVALIDDMVDALAAGDGAAVFTTIDRVADAGHDPRRFTNDLLERLRDLIVLQRVPDAQGSGIIDAPTDQLERMTAQAGRLGQATLSRLADIAHNGLTEMRGATAPRLLLELIAARMLLPSADDSQVALLHRLERMERRLGASDVPSGDAGSAEPPQRPAPAAVVGPAPSAPSPERRAPAPQAAPVRSAPPAPARPPAADHAVEQPAAERPAAPAPAASQSTVDAAPAAPGSIDAASVRRVWEEICSKLKAQRAPVLAAMLRVATVQDVIGNELVLQVQVAHVGKVEAQAELVAQALHDVFGGGWRVRAVAGGGAPSTSGGRSSAPSRPAAPRPAGSAGGGAADRTGSVSAAASARNTPSAGPTVRDAPAEGEDDGGWPEIAQPGGGVDASAAEDRPTGPAPAPRPGRTPSAARSAPPSAGRPTSTRGGPARNAAPGRPGASGDRGAPPPDEPPFDPDYDRAPLDRAMYDGFDPGDEPLDDGAPGARRSGEEQAIQAASEVFEVERIGDASGRP
jgi:DNA polymerase-3 subunit gamma/tau